MLLRNLKEHPLFLPTKNHKQNYILHNYYIFPILSPRKYNVIRKGGLYLLERRKEISVVTAQNPSILSFLIGEIPFLLFVTVLVYFFWIRPKRVERREEREKNEKILPPVTAFSLKMVWSGK